MKGQVNISRAESREIDRLFRGISEHRGRRGPGTHPWASTTDNHLLHAVEEEERFRDDEDLSDVEEAEEARSLRAWRDRGRPRFG